MTRARSRDARSGPRRAPLRRSAARGCLVLALAAALGGCSPLDDAMVWAFGRSMRNQPSFDPYENPRPAPEGAVPFSSGNFPAAPGQVNLGQPEGLAEDLPPFAPRDLAPPGSPAVNALVNPVPADAASLTRGQALYQRYCAVCHGDDGVGANAYIAEVHPTLPAFDVAGDVARGYSDGYLYGMIRVGRGLMPAYGHRITHFDRWHIVNYVRQLQGQAPAQAEGGAAASDGRAAGAPGSG